MFISKKRFADMQKELERLRTNNDCLQHDCVVMLDTAKEQREKITDLENNIELLVNNSKSKKIKELVNDCESIN